MIPIKIKPVGLHMHPSYAGGSAEDYYGTLSLVRAMGYGAIELRGLPATVDPTNLRRRLDKLGLDVVASCHGWEDVQTSPDNIAEFNQWIGSPRVVVSTRMGELDSREKVDNFLRSIEEVRRALSDKGVQLVYRNHAHEFLTQFDGSNPMVYIIANTTPEQFPLEFDVGWALLAGYNPIEFLMAQRGTGRVQLLNLKDAEPMSVGDIAAGKNPNFRELGKGCMDAMLAAAYLVVESDHETVAVMVGPENGTPADLNSAVNDRRWFFGANFDHPFAKERPI